MSGGVLEALAVSAVAIVSYVAIRAVVVRYWGRNRADRERRRTPGRDGRRAIRREDRGRR